MILKNSLLIEIKLKLVIEINRWWKYNKKINKVEKELYKLFKKKCLK